MEKFQQGETTKNEQGNTVVVLKVSSNLMPHLNVDMYSCFNGDSWVESEIDNYNEEHGTELDSGAFDFEWNADKVLKDLATASAKNVLDQLAADGIITGAEVVSTYSPREYNFATNRYEALWTVDLTKLNAWATDTNFDAAEVVRKEYSSYDGFISFVGGWLEDEPEDTILWLKLSEYLRAELDADGQFYAVQEAEGPAWSEHVVMKLDGENTEA